MNRDRIGQNRNNFQKQSRKMANRSAKLRVISFQLFEDLKQRLCVATVSSTCKIWALSFCKPQNSEWAAPSGIRVYNKQRTIKTHELVEAKKSSESRRDTRCKYSLSRASRARIERRRSNSCLSQESFADVSQTAGREKAFYEMQLTEQVDLTIASISLSIGASFSQNTRQRQGP